MKKHYLIYLLVLNLLGCSPVDLALGRADRLALLSQKSYQAAVRLYQDVLRKVSQGVKRDRICFKLAKLYFKAGDYPAAIEQLRRLNTSESRIMLAEAFFKNGDYTDALEIFDRLDEPRSAATQYVYGLALEKNNLFDKAQSIFLKIQNDPFYGSRAKRRLEAMNHNDALVLFGGVDDEVVKLIKNSPGQEKYPEASGLYLLSDDRLTLTDDNRLITETHCCIKILNDRGKEKFAEVVLSYDSTYEKLELEYARTILPDGNVVTVGDKNIRDVSVYLNFPLYSNARVRIISMPEVVPGAVIEYKMKLTQVQLPNKKDFNTTDWLQADEPILYQRSSISMPKGRILKYKLANTAYNTFGFDLTPRVREENGRTIYSLEFKDVPQIIPEPMMPPLSRIDPYILFSTFESWQDIYLWWRKLYLDKTIANDEIKAKVATLIKDKKTYEEKLRAIYNFCVADIRYVAVEYGDAGYEPHRAEEIFKNKYGDCKDKVILLVTMLKEAGIEAFPVLLGTAHAYEALEDPPNLSFNHAIAAVWLDEKLIFMDITAATTTFSDLPLGDQDRLALVFFKDKYQLIRTPLFSSQHNRLTTDMKLKVKSDESIEGARQVFAQGAFLQAQRYWLKFTMPILIEESLKQKIRSVADSALLKNYEVKNVDDLDQPVVLKYTFSAPQYFSKAGKSRLMAQLNGIDTSSLVKETRRYPVEFSGLEGQEDRIEVELPGHLAVKYVPAPVSVDTKWFVFECRYEIVNKKLLRIHFLHTTKEKVISAQEYGAYKKAIEDLAPLVNQQVVLEETR